ncbi:hypothetical protein SAICODRAFT_72327 [Saitoella complicata NRRL Y-17804]|nr:uncharacterized protein SAICODRAFT_72327 [Saitoella complicata NRRL Y-17804]ODQ51697.1 hypothetical protein SAICODRAFT_72327 [Saitoella complicata NRRL Y-17804]
MKKKVRAFYEQQNTLIEKLQVIDQLLASDFPHGLIHTYDTGSPRPTDLENQPLLGGDSPEETSKLTWLAINVNFAANVFLLAAKVVVALATNSLSILASLVDSSLDFLSTVIIWTTAKIIENRDWKSRYQFPVGRNRLEPIGVLVFAVIMTVAFFQVAVQAGHRLLFEESREVVRLTNLSIGIMASTVLVKGLCWLWCKNFKTTSVQALAQDAMNDVVFNFFSIVFPLVGGFFSVWWLDSLGAILISLYIVVEWLQTSAEHIQRLSGMTAAIEDQQQIVYLAARFSNLIQYVTMVNAYHAGDKLVVEVEICLDPKTSLKDGHDLGEALQWMIECLPNVERAHVHLDYSHSSPIGHKPR